MSRLIWIYAVCNSLLLSPVKELKEKNCSLAPGVSKFFLKGLDVQKSKQEITKVVFLVKVQKIFQMYHVPKW